MLKTNTLTLFFTPSPLGFNWSSPRSLAISAVKNKLTLKKRFMGHVYIGLKGTLSSGEEIEFVTGMKAKKLNAVPLIFFKGYGLGVLFHSFDGHLESKEDIWPEMQNLAKKGDLTFAHFKLPANAIDHLYRYYKEYKENDIGRYYGFVNRPLFGEGSGCSAFGASFLTTLGLMNDELKKSWSDTIKIPLDLAGPPVSTSRVNFFKILLNGKSWAQEKPYQQLDFWDPDKMHRWVLTNYQNKTFPLDNWYNAKGISLDYEQARPDLTGIWKHQPKNNKLSVKPKPPFTGPWID